MKMFGTGLARPHRQLLGATTLGIHVDQHAEAGLLKLPESEIRDFDPLFSSSVMTRPAWRMRSQEACCSLGYCSLGIILAHAPWCGTDGRHQVRKAPGYLEHPLGLAERSGHTRLGEHVFSSLQGAAGCFAMKVGRSSYPDHIDIVGIHHGFPVRHRAGLRRPVAAE